MRGFRRSPGVEHLVHAVELPELSRRRPAAARKKGPRALDGSDGGAHGPVNGGSGGVAFRTPGLNTRDLGERARGARRADASGGELREVNVPRPTAATAKVSPASASASTTMGNGEAQADAGRIDLLERRLAKLARLLEERDEQLRLRMEGRDAPHSVASIYSEVQGLRGESEEIQRKRTLMASIFDANRKLRERIGSTAQESE